MKTVWVYTISLSGKVSSKKAQKLNDWLFDLLWFMFGKKVISVIVGREEVSNDQAS
jgi:hypothetical protein